MTFSDVSESCRSSSKTGTAFRQHCMEEVGKIDGYDWSGVYRLEGDTLVLDSFVGAETDHTDIPVG